MRSNIKRFCMMIAYMAAVIAVTSCGAPKTAAPEKELHLAVILGSHNNAPKVNLSLIEDDVYTACRTFGSVTLIIDDGNPFSYCVEIPAQKEGLSSGKYEQIADEQASMILSAAGEMCAKTEQVDTLKAVQMAVRSLDSCKLQDGKEVERRLVILDSCLSTAGTLDFTKSRLESISVPGIVDQLAGLSEIPDMSRLSSVVVYTLGDTAGRQPPLTASGRQALESIWTAIFEAGSASSVDIRENLPLVAEYDSNALPAVNTVVVEQNSVQIADEEKTGDALEEGAVISFDETTLSFKPGSAELLDPETAEETLAYVIGFMKSHPEFELLVCGTTACWGGQEYTMDLSQKRAETICMLLCKNGIPEAQIKAIGVGYSFAGFYTYDQTEDGELDEEIAPMNRSVKIMDLHSQTAGEVLASR